MDILRDIQYKIFYFCAFLHILRVCDVVCEIQTPDFCKVFDFNLYVSSKYALKCQRGWKFLRYQRNWHTSITGRVLRFGQWYSFQMYAAGPSLQHCPPINDRPCECFPSVPVSSSFSCSGLSARTYEHFVGILSFHTFC